MIRYKSFADSGLIPPTDEVAGSQFYVSSVYGADTSNRGNKEQPFKSLDYAIGRCGTSLGDVIYVMPGHTESLASPGHALPVINFDVPGVTVIGLGSGTDIPTFTLTGVSTNDINIDAKNIKIKNLKFATVPNSLNAFFDVNESDFTIEDCILDGTGSAESSSSGALCFFDIATTKDNFKFKNCQFINSTDSSGSDGNAGTGCFYFVDSENIFVEDCFFNGFFETAIFHNKTTAAKNVWVKNCYGTQLLSGAEIHAQVANMTGGDLGSTFIIYNATDAAITGTWGVLSERFFFSLTSGVGNDGGGGSLAVAAVSAAA
jgi:hypothetical protein